MFNEVDWNAVWQATGETIYMVGISTFFTALFGIPLGILLVVTDRGQIWENTWLQKVAAVIVNFFRAVPFIVLVLFLFPVAEFLVGTSLGPTAATIPLIAGAAPFYARIVETALREVDKGVVEAALAMGTTRFRVVTKVLLPEATPALVSGLTVTCVTLISFSAMAGVVGGGGLGDAAYRFGFQSFNDGMLYVCGLLLVVMVQLIQWIGDTLSRRLDKR
ncbi:MAG: ABC transporter permease [Firmicutes bacterium]|uniref:D-methionine transport system permease protein n=1 Tax=Melghirimyces thermohalophilus TaxID=1236220 RepID=A0A1G6MF23_9BACL|nr:methionine ABC transporter permease [Melghirimyces thermohalophilus]MDA8353271.1 ABC transporter permease [Bacillota bacterium]SDC53867.1 D-methionine transport system permease protein [Melghirimyces thermohalophilus]